MSEWPYSTTVVLPIARRQAVQQWADGVRTREKGGILWSIKQMDYGLLRDCLIHYGCSAQDLIGAVMGKDSDGKQNKRVD